MGTKKLEGAKNLTTTLYKSSLFIELIVVFVLFQILTDGIFITTRNLSNLMMQGVTCSLIAVTMMLVIVSCNADLSAGSALGCMGTIAAILQVTFAWGTNMTILAVFASAIAIGLWHGYWIAYKKLPAFIVTLATQLVLKGLILLIGNGASIGPVSESFSLMGKAYLPNVFLKNAAFNDLSLLITIVLIALYIVFSVINEKKRISQGLIQPNWKKRIATLSAISVVAFGIASIFIFYKGFPYAILILIALTALFHFIVKNTKFGRYVFAIGGNADAARLSGINIERVTMEIFILHSIVVALASIVYLGRVGQGTASAGTGFEFTAITGCVVGGTSIMGGRGNVIGAVIGTMLMASLDNGMSLLNMGQSSQYIIKGLVLMLAIAMDVISRNKNG